mmetsp:Transcript_12396/g.26083  ORF Transcript_12396/g.26083 Transcript_12396/m.26083 type:complete len:225 (-) Transcript_12396:859-1533(-)|eukprot:CAMPEP_0118922968 /NCGR_PEP_ID=MMETSP1169-20130426/1682_1 /TAXON_ID=36882 /ORGANISM="Pyramimonas obovata, Strain CCMP722" /LENGTH=224 /DNA_ID=CAMNT_0006863897 /DNA_START=249 /DNA_END=923 /DNA_ORIENTATION=+
MKSIKEFFKKPDPKELVRKWQSELRSQGRGIDRQIREIQREEKKVEKSIKECAKRNDVASAKLLAKELVRSRRAVTRLATNKAQLNSVSMKLGENLAMVKSVGHLEKSTEVMKAVNDLIKIPEMNQTMREMSKEMMKAGMIEEMVSDSIDSAIDEDGLEEETDAEVDKVLAEVAGEYIAAMPGTQTAKQAAMDKQQQAEAKAAADAQQDAEFQELQARLNAVRM